MFCGQCGTEMPETAQFCSACGAPLRPGTPAAGRPGMPFQGGVPLDGLHRLVRPREGRMAAGVCAGLALHYGWDLSIVRLIAALIVLFSAGTGFLAYVILWIVMPEQPWALPSTTGTIPPGM